jgi:hypothetical protein
MKLVNVLVGLALFAFGAFFLFLEVRTPPMHSGHVYLFAGIAILGALVIRPDPIFFALKQVVVIVGPYIPVIGGRRAGDPPAPPAP